MLYEPIDDPEATSPDELRERYETALGAVVEAVGVEAAAAETGIEAGRLRALVAGDSPDLTVEEAAAVLALSDEWPDAETILVQVRDHLMLSMSSAVLDVEAIESGLNTDLDARAIQQKVEGRQPMTLAEYALVHQFVASESR